MKGTGVVHGLKSLAAKIHPQSPLDAKESDRLLTALTSSFRKHLDEAHPTAAIKRTESDKDTTSKHSGVAGSRSHSIHSSAVYADRHLAFVLTNPLLVKGGQRLDYASAKRELVENPAKDPILLFEEYHEKNAATVGIAELCMENFKKDLTNMKAEARKAYILKSEPGRRVFSWLLQNKVYDAVDYVDNLRFQDMLAYFLVLEGREENIWDWIKLDITIKDGQKEQLHWCKRKQTLHSYRWRGRLLRKLIEVKLGYLDMPKKPVNDDRLHEALDTYFKACELKILGQQRRDHLAWIPLGRAGSLLHREIAPDSMPRKNMDVRRYEKFCEAVPLYLDGAPSFFFSAGYATLDLGHPSRPSAERAFRLWQAILGDHSSPVVVALLSRFASNKDSAETNLWFSRLVRTIYVLQDEGRSQDASWLVNEALRHFPKQSPYLGKELDAHLVHDSKAATRPSDNEAPIPVPIPTFA